VSAFGGIVAVNRPVSVAMAEALAPVFTEVVVAPGYEEDALGVLQAKKNLRILEAAAPHVPPFSLRTLDGGYLVQNADAVAVDRDAWRVVTRKAPTDEQWADLALACASSPRSPPTPSCW